MNLDLLARLVRNSRYLPRGPDSVGAALSILPALADGLPDLRFSRETDVSLPVACTGMLTGPVERGLRSAIDEALAEMRPDEDQARRLSVDPLVLSLRRVLAEGGSVSLAGASLGALEYTRLCAQALASPGTLLADGVRQLNALPTGRRGRALAAVSSAMRSRLAIAVMEQARGGQAFSALVTALTNSPLPYLFTRGNLPAPLDFPLLHAAIGGPSSDEQVDAATNALRFVVSGVLARVATRKTTPDDQVFSLRFCLPQLLDLGTEAAIDSVLSDAEMWSSVLPTLGKYADAKQLAAAGMSSELAKQLLRPDVAVATASAIRATLAAVRAWDVILCVTGALQTVAPDDPIERRLTVPRGQAVEATVCVVGLAGLRSQGNDPAAIPAAATDAWLAWTAGAAGTLRTDNGTHGIVVFPDAKSAVRFGTSLRSRATGGLPVPPVAIATGRVLGGTDGATSRIGGPALREALRLLSPAALAERPEGMFAAAHIAVVGGQLAGSGVVVDSATLELLKRAGFPAAMEKKRHRQLGIRDSYEVEGELLVLLDIPGLAGGYEAVGLSPADWDAVVAATNAASTVRSPLSVPPPERPRGRKKSQSREEAEARATAEPIALDAEADEPLSAGFAFAESTEPGPEPAVPDEPAFVPPEPVVAEAPATTGTFDDPFGDAGQSSVFHVDESPEPAPQPAPAADPFAFAPTDDAPAGFAFADEPAAEDPFAKAANPERAAPKAADPFGDIFGIPVGAESSDSPPPTTAAPMMGTVFSLEVEDDEDEPTPPSASRIPAPPRTDGRTIQEEEAGFALPVVEGGEAIRAPSAQPVVVTPPPVDFGFLLNGYACYVEHERVVFGRPYGTRLIDHHTYDTQSNLDRAYQAFLEDKIKEGFIPQTEMVGELPRGVTVMPLDSERLASAWRALT